MINLSKTGLIGDLIEAVKALPDASELDTAAKEAAILMLRAEKGARAHLNLRANVLSNLASQQLEIQVTGKK
jgi:hypothetical protein